jgi:adenosylmethionine-8-amino-7-oxononanoate aminotransferase
MSATVANDRVYEAFLGPDLSARTLYHGHSYGGNALAAAVAHRHLQLLADGIVFANVRSRSEQLRDGLERAVGRHPGVAELRLRGLMGGLELAPPTEGLRWGRRVSAACVRRGVLIRPLGDVVVIMPPLTVTPAEIDRIVTTVAAAVEEVCTKR